MQLWIDNKSGRPIYEQLCGQLREQIQQGLLQEDDMLPSIRNLAKDLRISVITTKRVYDELEREGLIYTVAGKGSFVAACNPDLQREEHLKKMEEHIKEILRLGRLCGLTGEDLAQLLCSDEEVF